MSELKKELPSPGIMRNLPSPLFLLRITDRFWGTLERRIQEEYVSKVADSLVYKTMVKQQETRDLAVSVAARKISEIPGVKGEGTEDTEDGGIEAVPIRTTCQRCEGLGWMHSDTKKKHERAKNVQCRNCSSCGLCKGTGVLMNTLMCDDCNAYGFIHPRSDIPSCTMGVRCINCFDCPACDGRGLFDITPVIHSGKVNDEICDTDHVETGDKVQIPIQQST
ncbi:hypothetical protein BC829DRAFT_251767 [Chytridium lagenaria]|nr:hypothetical protein BC829DRAFT_251767 [Chytridium lagenaria]